VTPARPHRVWLLPGMGADRRLFANLKLDGPPPQHAEWIPAHPQETLTAYAERFAQHHGIGASDTLVGVSMGGMVAAALVQRYPRCRLILVSSGTSISQTALLVRWLAPWAGLVPFGLVRWLPVGLMPARLRLPMAMAVAQDPAFIRWACAALRYWPGVPRPVGTISIHGSADRLFPLARQSHVDITIRGGGHLMILDRVDEVGAAVRAVLESSN